MISSSDCLGDRGQNVHENVNTSGPSLSSRNSYSARLLMGISPTHDLAENGSAGRRGRRYC